VADSCAEDTIQARCARCKVAFGSALVGFYQQIGQSVNGDCDGFDQGIAHTNVPFFSAIVFSIVDKMVASFKAARTIGVSTEV